MPIDNSNNLSYGKEYRATLYGVINKYINEYQDEFALRNFLDEYRLAMERLEYVGASDGNSSDETLIKLGLKRMKIKKSKYMIVYKYENGTVYLYGVHYSGRDFSRVKF